MTLSAVAERWPRERIRFDEVKTRRSFVCERIYFLQRRPDLLESGPGIVYEVGISIV